MSQEMINKICRRLGIEPIIDLPLPSEDEFEKMHNALANIAYDTMVRAYNKPVAFSNFKMGYIASEIKKRIK